MTKAERRQVVAICEHVTQLTRMTKGTKRKGVPVTPVAQVKRLLQRWQYRQAENLAYEILMDSQSEDGNDGEPAECHMASETPHISVRFTVDIGRSIKFVRVAAGIRQGVMAKRLAITQNYLSLLENNKAEPSLSLLKKISAEFNVPVSFLLLESSVEFESRDPERDALLKHLRELIHQLQRTRIKEGDTSSHDADDGGH